MSVWDYVLPWKAIPNMVKDVKDASSLDGKGKDKYDSVFGAIGKYADPAGALLGDKWMDFWHGEIPAKMNQAVRPWNEFHMKYLDPVAMAGGMPKEMEDAAKYKGADVTAAALGATALGMMLGGAAGAGGGAGGGGAGGGTGGGASSMVNPWQQAAGQLGSMLQEAGKPQPLQPQAGQGMGGPQAGQMDGLAALKQLMQEAPNAKSLDELAERMASYGAPPSFGNDEAAAQPAVQVNVQAPPVLGPSGRVPRIPMTRGEAETNVSVGQMLGGWS